MFQYLPLADPTHIRLLRFLDSDIRSDTIRACELVHVDRHALPPSIDYVALSYRWGDEAHKTDLHIWQASVSDGDDTERTDGGLAVLKVPVSTMSMLQDLHSSGWIRDKWFWIDYVCLNQGDLAEKGEQVANMGQLYELCQQTLVYAGPAGPTTPLAMSFWAKLKAAFDGDWARRSTALDDGSVGHRHLSYEELLDRTGTDWDSPEWKALGELLTTPWFGRLWVMQEAVLPHSLVFIWGRYSLPWDELSQYLTWDRRSHLSQLLANTSVQPAKGHSPSWTSTAILGGIKKLRDNRQSAETGWQCDLSFALWNCWAATATDPRDRIYGLLGLLHGQHRPLKIVPNYRPENTQRKVFTDATAQWLRANDALDLLYMAGIGWRAENADLPSWVPDYTLTGPQYPGEHLKAGKGNIERILKPLARRDDELLVQVYVVDNFDAVVSFADDSGAFHANYELDTHLTWYLKASIELLRRRHSAPWPDDFFETFWRTLTSNSVVNENIDSGTAWHVYGDICASLDVVRESGVFRYTGESTPLARQRFLTTVAGYHADATMGLTAKGWPALVPRYTTAGDVVAVALGSRLPFILRPVAASVEGKEVFQFLGTGYIHCLNDGIHVAASEGDLRDIAIR